MRGSLSLKLNLKIGFFGTLSCIFLLAFVLGSSLLFGSAQTWSANDTSCEKPPPSRKNTTKQKSLRKLQNKHDLSRSQEKKAAELIQKLLGWIESTTSYDVSDSRREPPIIRFCKTGDKVSYEGHGLIVDKYIAALFDFKTKTIQLVEPWNFENPRDVGRLLHELVHDVQTRKRNWDCWGNAEREAYKLQEKWLLEQGVKPNINWMVVFVITRCPRDIHPE